MSKVNLPARFIRASVVWGAEKKPYHMFIFDFVRIIDAANFTHEVSQISLQNDINFFGALPAEYDATFYFYFCGDLLIDSFKAKIKPEELQKFKAIKKPA